MVTLAQEFTADHREMTKLLTKLYLALDNNDDTHAVELSNELDLLGGPHIQFEETVLYPELGRSVGTEFENRLRREHHYPLSAIRFLMAYQDDPQLTFQEREKLKSLIQQGLEHVETCGRLMSHLTTLTPTKEKRLLKQLHDMKRTGTRWTDFASTHDD